MDHRDRKGNPSLCSDLASQVSATSELHGARFAGNDVGKIPQDVSIVLHDILELVCVPSALYEGRDGRIAATGLAQPVGTLGIALTVPVFCAVSHEELYDLILISDNAEGDSLEFGQLERRVSPGGNVDVAAALFRSLGHVEDGSHGGPECVYFTFPIVRGAQNWRYGFHRDWRRR